MTLVEKILYLFAHKKTKMKENNYLIKDDFVNEEVLDEVVSSVKSYDDVVALCKKIKKPESLRKQQKERLVKKLIKFSKTYDEILKVKDYYATEVLHYSLTDKQVWRLIEKLVWASTNDNQLDEIKRYARSKGCVSRYMKVLFNKRIAEVFAS